MDTKTELELTEKEEIFSTYLEKFHAYENLRLDAERAEWALKDAGRKLAQYIAIKDCDATTVVINDSKLTLVLKIDTEDGRLLQTEIAKRSEEL